MQEIIAFQFVQFFFVVVVVNFILRTASKIFTFWSWKWKYARFIFRRRKTHFSSWVIPHSCMLLWNETLCSWTITAFSTNRQGCLQVMPCYPQIESDWIWGKDLTPFVFQMKHRVHYIFLMVSLVFTGWRHFPNSIKIFSFDLSFYLPFDVWMNCPATHERIS